MNDVAAVTGVSKVPLYVHFMDNEELLVAVVNWSCEGCVDADVAGMMDSLPLREALATFGHRMLDAIFAADTLGLHRVVIAESYRFPALGRLFYDSGPGSAIITLTAYLERHRQDPALKIADPRRAAEEFMALLRGYEHMRALLGIEGVPPRRKLKERVASAVAHVTRCD